MYCAVLDTADTAQYIGQDLLAHGCHDPPGFSSDVFQWYLTEPVRLDPVDGCMAVPDRPGLGVELDEDKIKRYAIAR